MPVLLIPHKILQMKVFGHKKLTISNLVLLIPHIDFYFKIRNLGQSMLKSAISQKPKHFWIFTKKYWELVELENDLSLRRPFWFFCFIFWKRPMGYRFFLYYRWLLQNLRKDFIRTNMHTTVASLKSKAYNVFFPIIILHFWMVQSYINLGIPC